MVDHLRRAEDRRRAQRRDGHPDGPRRVDRAQPPPRRLGAQVRRRLQGPPRAAATSASRTTARPAGTRTSSSGRSAMRAVEGLPRRPAPIPVRRPGRIWRGEWPSPARRAPGSPRDRAGTRRDCTQPRKRGGRSAKDPVRGAIHEREGARNADIKGGEIPGGRTPPADCRRGRPFRLLRHDRDRREETIILERGADPRGVLWTSGRSGKFQHPAMSAGMVEPTARAGKIAGVGHDRLPQPMSPPSPRAVPGSPRDPHDILRVGRSPRRRGARSRGAANRKVSCHDRDVTSTMIMPTEGEAGEPPAARCDLRAEDRRGDRRDREGRERRPDDPLEPDQQPVRRHGLPGQPEAAERAGHQGVPDASPRCPSRSTWR